MPASKKIRGKLAYPQVPENLYNPASSIGAQLAPYMGDYVEAVRLARQRQIRRRRAMEYRDIEFQYELHGEELGTEAAREQSAGKQYRSKRSSKTTRRKAPKVTHPGPGIAGRRNRRWAW
jgi:hypothetical protein